MRGKVVQANLETRKGGNNMPVAYTKTKFGGRRVFGGGGGRKGFGKEATGQCDHSYHQVLTPNLTVPQLPCPSDTVRAPSSGRRQTCKGETVPQLGECQTTDVGKSEWPTAEAAPDSNRQLCFIQGSSGSARCDTCRDWRQVNFSLNLRRAP